MVRLYTNSFVPIQRFRDEFDRVVRGIFGEQHQDGGAKFSRAEAFPAVNLWEEEDAVKVEAEVPGLTSENLEIAVLGSELRIEGKLPRPDADEATYHRRERAHGEFRRVVRLPADVAADKVEASLHDGVLLITLPKAPAARPHKIKVSQA